MPHRHADVTPPRKRRKGSSPRPARAAPRRLAPPSDDPVGARSGHPLPRFRHRERKRGSRHNLGHPHERPLPSSRGRQVVAIMPRIGRRTRHRAGTADASIASPRPESAGCRSRTPAPPFHHRQTPAAKSGKIDHSTVSPRTPQVLSYTLSYALVRSSTLFCAKMR